MQSETNLRHIEIDETVPLEGNPKIQFEGVLNVLKAGTENMDTVHEIVHLLRTVPEIHNNVVYASFLRVRLGHFYYNQKDYRRATFEYQKAAETRPDWVAPHWWLVYAWIEVSKMDQDPCKRPYTSNVPSLETALDHIEQALAMGVENHWPMIELRGYCQMMLGEYQEAIDTLMPLTEIEDKAIDKFHVWNKIGSCANVLGDWTNGMQYYLKAMWLRDDEHTSRFGYANALAAIAKVAENNENYKACAAKDFRDKAIAEFQTAITLATAVKSDKVPDYYCNLGLTLYEAGRETDAHECYRYAIIIAPENAQIHIRRGSFRLLTVKHRKTVPEKVREAARDDFLTATVILVRDAGLTIELHQDVRAFEKALRQLIYLD